MKKKNAEANAETQAAPVILAYVGPTLAGIANKGEVYTGGVPSALSAAAKTKPQIAKLIVELPEMPNAQRDIILRRGVYYAAYNSVLTG